MQSDRPTDEIARAECDECDWTLTRADLTARLTSPTPERIRSKFGSLREGHAYWNRGHRPFFVRASADGELRADGGRSGAEATHQPTLKFSDTHHEAILDGSKTVTIRVDPDHPYNEAEPVTLTDAEGTPLAEAVVTDRSWTTTRMAYEMNLVGHRPYDTLDDLLAELRGYYPDTEIDATTQVQLIEWELVDDE